MKLQHLITQPTVYDAVLFDGSPALAMEIIQEIKKRGHRKVYTLAVADVDKGTVKLVPEEKYASEIMPGNWVIFQDNYLASTYSANVGRSYFLADTVVGDRMPEWIDDKRVKS